MFIFGKKNKKDEAKEKLIKKIDELIELSPSPSVTRLLKEMISDLGDQPMVSGKFVQQTDEKIMMRLAQAKSDIAKKDTGSAVTRLNSIKNLIASRAIGKEINDYDAGYTDEELSELYVQRLNSEMLKARQEVEKCKKALLANPTDKLSASNYKLAAVNLKKADTLLAANLKQRERVTTMEAMKGLSDEYKRIIADENSSEEEFFKAAEEFNNLHADMVRLSGVTDEGIKMFSGANLDTGAVSDLKVEEVNYAELYGLTDEPAQAQQVAQEKSAAPKSSDGYDEELFENIEEAIDQLEKARELYNLKQNKANRKYEENSQKLVELVQKFKTTPEALRGPIDAQIKSLYAETDGLKKEIQQYESAKVVIEQKLKLQRSALVQKEIHTVNKALEGTSAATANMEAVAMQIKTSIESTNAENEAIGTANAVAESAVPVTDSLFDYEQAVNEASANADDKYDFLLKGLK